MKVRTAPAVWYFYLPRVGEVCPVGDDVLRDQSQGRGGSEVERGDLLGEGKTKDKRKEAVGGWLSLRVLTQIECKYQDIRQTSQHTDSEQRYAFGIRK